MTPKAVLDLAKKNEVKIVDIKFTDLLGTWQHFSVPTSELEESLFEDGPCLMVQVLEGGRPSITATC